jgi:predicted phosphoribosyltransferase
LDPPKPGGLPISRNSSSILAFSPVDFFKYPNDRYNMSFASRQDAGQKLGRHLLHESVEVDVVLGLPRGGVIVAAEVAHTLQRPLDVLIVRKIGHPLHREFAVGALAENDIVLLDEKTIGATTEIARSKLVEIIQEEKERLEEYQLKFHSGAAADISGKSVVLVDDGLATGATMEAAVLSAKKQGARKVIVAVPVGSTSSIIKLERVADAVVSLIDDPGFNAVGAYYEEFSQTEDEEVMDLLRAEHAHH